MENMCNTATHNIHAGEYNKLICSHIRNGNYKMIKCTYSEKSRAIEDKCR